MKKIIPILLLLCIITSCKQSNTQVKEDINFSESKIKDELISKTTVLIDSAFNEISPDYLSIRIDSINVYKFIPLKGKRLEEFEFNSISAYAIDKEFVDLFIKSIESEKTTKDSVIGYIGFLKVKSKVEVIDKYLPLLTEEQKLEAQRDIKGSEESYFIPNILTSDFKQFDLKKLNKN